MRTERVAGAAVVVTLIAVVVLTWLAEPAYAVGSRSDAVSLPLRQTVWSDTLRLPSFDPTLGELVRAEVSLRVDARVDATIENTAAVAEPALPVRLGGRVRLTASPSLIGLGLPATITAQRTTTVALGPFDAVDDGAGASGRQLVDEDVTTTFSADYTDQAVLDAMVAGSSGDTLRVTVAATGVSNAAFTVDGRAEFRTEVALSGAITYTYLQPAFALRKSAVTPAVVPGGTARFLITAINTGETALRNVVVSDPQAPDCERRIGELPLGVQVEYACEMAEVTIPSGSVPGGTVPGGTVPGGTGAGGTGAGGTGAGGTGGGTRITNTATATASSGATELNAEAVAHVVVGTAELEVIAEPPSQSVRAGASALVGFAVVNRGTLALRDITARSAASGGCGGTIARLAAGETARLDCRLDDVTDAVRVTIGVLAQSDLGPVAATAEAEVVIEASAASLQLQTTIDGKDPDHDADAALLEIGEPVPIEVVVTNTGSETLRQLSVNDELAGPLRCPETTLAPAASVRCTGSLPGPLGFGPRTHTTTAQALDIAGGEVSAQDRTVHRGTRQAVCAADADLLVGLRFRIGDAAEVHTLAALRPQPGDRLVVEWEAYRADGDGCRVSLAQHDTDGLLFDASVEQPLVAAVSCTDHDCRSATGYRLELIVADTGGPNQFDLVTGPALASVGPRGGYYSSTLNRALHRLLDHVTG